MSETWARRAPFFGFAVFVFGLIAFITSGSTPAADASAAEIAKHFDDQTKQAISSVCTALMAVFFTFFAGTLRSRMRAADGSSNLTLVGGAIFAVGLAILAGLNFTLMDVVNANKHIGAAALQALNALSEDLFFPAIVGLAVFYFSTAHAILATSALPRWWGWVTLVLAIVSIAGPLGFIGYLASVPWALVAAILLMRTETASGPSNQEAPAAAS